MMKNRSLILITLILFTISCISVESEKETNSIISESDEEYFEGVIEYSIDYKLINTSISKEKLKRFLGTKIIRSFRKGNWRDEYYNDKGALVRISILNQTNKKYYYEMLGNDTVYYSDINITNYNTTIEQLSDTTISNHECWTIKSLSVRDCSQSDTVESVFYISKQLKVDSDWFANYIDGGYNEIYKIAPGISIASEHTNADFIQIRKLVSKRNEKIDDSEFKVESNKYVKKTNLQ